MAIGVDLVTTVCQARGLVQAMLVARVSQVIFTSEFGIARSWGAGCDLLHSRSTAARICCRRSGDSEHCLSAQHPRAARSNSPSTRSGPFDLQYGCLQLEESTGAAVKTSVPAFLSVVRFFECAAFFSLPTLLGYICAAISSEQMVMCSMALHVACEQR